MSYLTPGSDSKNFKEASVGRNMFSTCILQILMCFKSNVLCMQHESRAERSQWQL
jgi:hypothetical protein